jgi:hypothetical protein
MGFMSCAFGTVGKPLSVGIRVADAFGRRFPDPEVLAAMPAAMRREAALLAEDAGLTPPLGALPFAGPVQPHCLPGLEPNAWLDRGVNCHADLLDAYMDERLEDAGDEATLSSLDLRADLEAWCAALGAAVPDRVSLSARMTLRWPRFRANSDPTCYRGVRFK